jgi:hypothetical protein
MGGVIAKEEMMPSDIDMVVDNDGYLLFVKLKSDTASWEALPVGQYRMYINLVRAGRWQKRRGIMPAQKPRGGQTD